MSCQENEEHRHAGVTDRTQRDDEQYQLLLVLYLPVNLAASGQKMTASPERLYLIVICDVHAGKVQELMFTSSRV